MIFGFGLRVCIYIKYNSGNNVKILKYDLRFGIKLGI